MATEDDDFKSWATGVIEQVNAGEQEDFKSWANGVLDQVHPHRKIEYRQGIYYPKTEREFENLPDGAHYALPEEHWPEHGRVEVTRGTLGHDSYTYHPRTAFRIRNSKAVPAALAKYKSWRHAIYDEPTEVVFNPATNEYQPKDVTQEEIDAQVASMKTQVSDTSLGRVLQTGQLGIRKGVGVGLQPFMDDEQLAAYRRESGVYDRAAEEMHGAPGFIERNARGVAGSVGQQIGLAPYAALTGGASPVVFALGSGAISGGEAYQKSRDAGKSELEATNYAIEQGGYEAGVTLVFSALGKFLPGLGGAEDALSPATAKAIRDGVAKHGVRGYMVREVAKHGGGEVPEEWIIKGLQDESSQRYGFEVQGGGWEYFETGLQAAIVGGAANAPRVVGETRGAQRRIAAELQTPEGAAKWATAHPERAKQIVAEEANQSRTTVADITGTNRAPPADARAEQARRAAELRTAAGAAKWAAENPELARLIVNDKENQTRGRIANITRSLRDAWGKRPARDRFMAQIEGALGEQKATAAQPSDRRQAGDTRQTASAVGRKAGPEYKSEPDATLGRRSRPDSPSTQPAARFPQEGFATLTNGSRVQLGKGSVTENGDIFVPGKQGKPGRTYPASAVARIETPDGQTAWRKPPHTPTASSRPSSQSPANSSIRESPPNVRSDATAQPGREAPRGPNAPRVPNATNTPPTPQAAHVPEGGFATLENGSRVAFGPGAVSENGDIVVPGKGGKPAQIIPASKIVHVESPDGRSTWRRPPRGNASNAPSAGPSPTPSAAALPSSKSTASSPAGKLQERREAARAQLAAAQAELRRLNVGLGKNPVPDSATVSEAVMLGRVGTDGHAPANKHGDIRAASGGSLRGRSGGRGGGNGGGNGGDAGGGNGGGGDGGNDANRGGNDDNNGGDEGNAPAGGDPGNQPRMGAAGNLIPPVLSQDLPLAVRHTLLEIKGSQVFPVDVFNNTEGRLPKIGENPPLYVEFDVPTPGSKAKGGKKNRGDRRVMYDKANDLWYYSGNAHKDHGNSADFVEIIDMQANLPID